MLTPQQAQTENNIRTATGAAVQMEATAGAAAQTTTAAVHHLTAAEAPQQEVLPAVLQAARVQDAQAVVHLTEDREIQYRTLVLI